jgi:acetoin utilization deacetylase AcuC-like enzyme
VPWHSALVLHPDCGRHDTGWRHPEHQGRLPAILQAIYRDTPALQSAVLQREGSHAPLDAVLRVHTAEHVAGIERLASAAGERDRPVFVNTDTAVSTASFEAALAAAGCARDAVGIVMNGEARSAFALCRPPGHHASSDVVMGFCLMNNAAIAARVVQAEWRLERVLIVDWDVHHGNGTQDIFFADSSVYYLSLHQSPWYPGTGTAAERGVGPGLGTTLNVPLPAGTDGAAFLSIFRDALAEVLSTFTPDFIIVSAGFDCLAGDPLGRLELQPADMHALATEVRQRADEVAGGRLALVLEGGYAPERVGHGVVDVFRALSDLPPRD